MGFEKDMITIKRIHELIRLKSTGTPEELARKLGIHKRMVYYYIEVLKALGAPIVYDKHIPSYVYTHPVRFNMPFSDM